MRGWRAVGAGTAALLASVVVLGALLQFLAPEVSFQVRDGIAEVLSGRRGRTYRIALGTAAGTNYRVGQVLNQHLRERAGYELELVETLSTGNVSALFSPDDRIDFATINSADDGAVGAQGLVGIAALERQYFFVLVPNDSPVHEFRDLSGRVNPGVRGEGDPPTLGERVLDFYGMLSPGPAGDAPVTVVRPSAGVLEDLASGHNVAATRTQFLRSDLIDRTMQSGNYRLLPIRDHQALAGLLPGTTAAFIPAGLYGPGRRVPAEPVPTIAVLQLLIARSDVPGRIVRDLLEVIYSPQFARDMQYTVTEAQGERVGGLPLHPAAEIFYRRNDAITSDRLGRLSFVASAIAGLVAVGQFLSRYRTNDRVKQRRKFLGAELAKLRALRARIADGTDPTTVRDLVRDADDLLCEAEQNVASGLLDADGIQAFRSLHRVCVRTVDDRLVALAVAPLRSAGATDSPPAVPDQTSPKGHVTEREA